MGQSGITWIAHERYSSEADIDLICFPYAGGSASYFAALKPKIDKRINVCPVLYPGREKNMKAKGFDTIEEMADTFVKERPDLFKKKFALMGHCTGSLIAYETALRAKQLYGVDPVYFIASSSPSPSSEQFFSKVECDDESMTQQLLNSKMIDESFASNDMFRSYFLPLIRKDLTMHMKYEVKEPFSKMNTPVFVMYGDEDYLFNDRKAIDGWSGHTTGKVDSRVFHGGHFYLDKNRKEAGELISELLLTEADK